MKRLMLVAVVALGCNYYGPDNPPPDPSPNPTFRVQYVQVTDPQGVAVAQCPAGSVVTASNCDCVWCNPPPGAYLFGCSVAGNAALAGCGVGCARVIATCMSSSIGNTLRQGLTGPDLEAEALASKWRAQAGESHAVR